MSVLINVMAILGLACTILAVLVAASFFIPAIRDRRREHRFMKQECADLAALDDPAALIAALGKTGSQGNAALPARCIAGACAGPEPGTAHGHGPAPTRGR